MHGEEVEGNISEEHGICSRKIVNTFSKFAREGGFFDYIKT
jgi:hypothetical protein